jgi:hypothetical protein
MADKDKQPKQADFDKAWDNMKAGKTMPTENDMGPLPPAKKEQIQKGLMQGLKGYSPSKEVTKFDENYKKGGKVKAATMTFETYTKTGKKAGLKTVPVKKMASGGKVSQLAKANGIAVRGKTKGRIC